MQLINAPDAPLAVGPYSHAARVGNLLLCSGQIPICPTEKKIIAHDIDSQTSQVFENIKAVLKSQGLTLKHVAKTTVFLQSMDDFVRMNAVYDEEFQGHKPARSTVEVAKLPLDALVEIECIATFPEP
ncbi:MAG: Rid family detoxifying hydrolase [Verrucomicrobiota bacterium]